MYSMVMYSPSKLQELNIARTFLAASVSLHLEEES